MSKNKDRERPPWWHYGARKEYNGAMKTYSEIQARVLPKEMASEFDVDLPPSWTEQPAMYLLRGLGYGKKGLPPGSGVGLVQSPWADIYTKIYGANPIADLPKYRKMYRTQPDIQQAVQMQVNLALGKGYTIGHDDEDVVKYLEKATNKIDLNQKMLVMGTDALVYGNSYTEIQWDKTSQKKEQMYEYEGCYYSKTDLEKLEIKKAKPASIDTPIFNASKDDFEFTGAKKNFVAQVTEKVPEAKTIVGLKCLDPLYVRVRRDSYGNQYGFIQWIGFPPVIMDNESCFQIKYRPQSWGYEDVYGCSILMPIIKNNELLMQFENDGATWIHSKAVPPLIIKGGTPEKPYSTSQMTDLMGALKSRTAATMIFTKGDVSFEEFKTIASDLNLTWWLDFLLLRRYQSLGVPPILMGYVKAGARGIAEVVLHDFVARLQVLQEFIADPIEEYIFKPLIKARFGDDVENAEIIWKPIIEEDKNMRSQRLIQMLQAGAISVNELRVEQGFKQLEDKKYDKVNVVEPGMQPSGFPPKPGAAAQPKSGGPETERVNQQTKKPPESHMKLEDIKTKKIQLLQLEESFRTKMLDLTSKTKFDLKDDGKLVKQVKQEAQAAANNIINEHVAASYLVGRMSANASIGLEDDLSLKQEDLQHLAKLKQCCVADFEKIVNDMVVAKEEGQLE